MKGLRKYLSPFTPDQSGAVSVLFGYKGLLIIMDAGGCVGNICGYDEPRWYKEQSAICSAGLRDLDAILGRDELLIQKTHEALKNMDATFVGLIGTPVPAVIATDYKALKKLMEKDFGRCVIPIETNGMDLYDKGQELAYLQLFREFIGSEKTMLPKAYDVAIIGATPLDMCAVEDADEMKEILGEQGRFSVVCYGCGDDISAIATAHKVGKNIVVSPSGLACARWMQKHYGIAYEVTYPIQHFYMHSFTEKVALYGAKKILIVHQQVFANEVRTALRASLDAETIDVATWFMLDEEIGQANDTALLEEDDLGDIVCARGYDMVIGDPLFLRALGNFKGIYLDLPHFAVSGALHASKTSSEFWQKAGERR